MFIFNLELSYIDSIKSNTDFVCAYIVQEEVVTIWLVIKDSSFIHNKKYFIAAREYEALHNCNFNLCIFEEDQLSEIGEQLKVFESYIMY